MSKRKIKPQVQRSTAPAWRVTSAHLTVPGMTGRAVVVSKAGLYDWKVPTPHGEDDGCERDFEAACRAAVRAMTNKHRAWCLNTDPAWTITGAVMEIPGAAVRRLSVQQIGDEFRWAAFNEGREAARAHDDSMPRAQDAAEQWARGPGWMPWRPGDDYAPACVASMGCLCAGHARGNAASAACDTSETGE